MTPDRSWMEPFVQALAGPALQLATLLTQDRAVGEDIVQEAFLRAWRSRNTPRDQAGFRRWLYRIVVNLSRDYHRRAAAWGRIRIVAYPATDPGVVVEDRAIGAALADAIGRLSRREREAVYLRFFEDADYHEVAEIIGLREGACRVLIHRALKKVGNQLSAEGLAPEGART